MTPRSFRCFIASGGSRFFTEDADFSKAALCHPAYALVVLAVGLDDFANMSRRFRRHPQFDTTAKRMGVVAEIRHQRILLWRRGVRGRVSVAWRRPSREP
jgi:hypothetical protein